MISKLHYITQGTPGTMAPQTRRGMVDTRRDKTQEVHWIPIDHHVRTPMLVPGHELSITELLPQAHK